MKHILKQAILVFVFCTPAWAHNPAAIPKALGLSFLIGLALAGTLISLLMRLKPRWSKGHKIAVSLIIVAVSIVLCEWLLFKPIYEAFGG